MTVETFHSKLQVHIMVTVRDQVNRMHPLETTNVVLCTPIQNVELFHRTRESVSQLVAPEERSQDYQSHKGLSSGDLGYRHQIS